MAEEIKEQILYGLPHSLYTGIARSYLRTQGIPFREVSSHHPDFARHIKPIIQRSIVPVLVTPAGEIIQDSLDIIDHFERKQPRYPAYPDTPLQRILAVLIQYYGTQSLLRPAMHYRWSYLDQQYDFLYDAFSNGAPPGVAETLMQRMQSYLPGLGVTADSIPPIEASYQELLAVLNRHFSEHPFLFGGRPSIADYGLIGPLFAHLGRDPVPAGVMKREAPRVYRWVERMLAPGLDTVEFPDYGTAWIAEDAIPETLDALLHLMARDMLPELTDKLAYLDAWVSERQPADGEAVSAKPHQRMIGQVHTHFRGVPVTAGVEPYLLYILRRAATLLADLNETDRQRVSTALSKVGLLDAVPPPSSYSVGRRNHIEIWQRQ